MRIKEISLRIDDQIKQLTFDQLLKMSDGHDISQLMHQAVSVHPNLKDQSQQAFIEYYRASLLRGTCYGQVLSLVAKEGSLRQLHTRAHVLDALRLQILHELTFELKLPISEEIYDEHKRDILPRMGNKGIGNESKLKKVQKISKHSGDNIQELIAKIRGVLKRSFQGLEKKQIIFEAIEENEMSIEAEFINIQDADERQLGTRNDIKKILESNRESYIIGTINPMDQQNDNGHSFCLMNKKGRFQIFDIIDKQERVYRTYAKIDRALAKLAENICSTFTVPIAYIKYSVFQPK